MRMDKEKALILRRQGKSYGVIKKLLGVPKSTLSDWLRTTDWSKKIKLELSQKAQKLSVIRLRELNKVYKRNLDGLYNEARKEAKEEKEKMRMWLNLLPKEFINNKYYKKEYYTR